MNPDAIALFRELADRSPLEREAYYAEHHIDLALRAEIESLLRYDRQSAESLHHYVDAAAARVIADQQPSPPLPDDSPMRDAAQTAALIGRRFGVFEVRGLVGAGGMGEVYRARDTRLGRDVAIKILSRALRDDREHIARFEREARVLASLNHPHIGVVHGLEDVDGVKALVMELVEGENLAERLARAPLLVNEALEIAGQVAEALEAAHAQGIVHRDLKPANIKRRPDGEVKVLDFGLAKPLAWSGSVATRTGLIGGTPAYMSPEQARGDPVDRQADIWSFGVVLYELLTGVSPFARSTTAETLAAVFSAAPDFTLLPRDTPSSVRHLIRCCVETDRRRRLKHIGDARLELEEASVGGVDAQPPPVERHSYRLLITALAAVATVALVIALVWFRPRVEVSRDSLHLTIMLPPGVSVTRGPGLGSSVALAPEGGTLVVAGTGAGGQRLYRRALNRDNATPLAGTEGASSPFFSWDGAWIGFFADGRLKRIPAGGGTAVDIVAVPGFLAGASWGADNRIVFAYGAEGRLHTVDSRGGGAEPLTAVKSGYYPEILPDGRTLLFEAAGWVHIYDPATGRQSRLLEGVAPRYASGYLAMSRGIPLLAAPLDLSRHTLTGPVVPLVDAVARDPGAGAGMRHYAMSRSGTLAYVPAASKYTLVLVGADGSERLLSEERRLLWNPQFSPDGRLVVVAVIRRDGERPDLWIHDLKSGTATQVTFDGGRAPVWTPDGSTVTYSKPGDRAGIYARRVDGRGDADARQLLALNSFHWLVGWTPDQRTLVYGLMQGTPSSIMALTTANRAALSDPDRSGAAVCLPMGGGWPTIRSTRGTSKCT